MPLLKSKYKHVNNLVKINFNVTAGEIEPSQFLYLNKRKRYTND